MSLSPWDLSGNVGFDVRQYRPRRPSYVFATQETAHRRGSYQNATGPMDDEGMSGCEHRDVPDSCDDFIEGMVRKKLQDNNRAAGGSLQMVDDLKMKSLGEGTTQISNHIGESYGHHQSSGVAGTVERIRSYEATNTNRMDTATTAGSRRDSDSSDSSVTHVCRTAESAATNTIFTGGGVLRDDRLTKTRENLAYSKWRYMKNLVVLSLSFILVFSAFRSIQNLQSSLNKTGRLGVTAMCIVHFTMFLTCLFAPVLVNKLSSKWTIVLGLVFYLFWIAANFFPHQYTLLPSSVLAGFGQSLAWGAQVHYIQQLALDSAHVSKELTHQELYKFNGIFLACFQTSHIWGNLVSSLILGSNKTVPKVDQNSEVIELGGGVNCGVYDSCYSESITSLWTSNSTGYNEFIPRLKKGERQMTRFLECPMFTEVHTEVQQKYTKQHRSIPKYRKKH